MKIVRRTPIILNTIAFTLLTAVYVLVLDALAKGVSVSTIVNSSSIMGGYYKHFIGLTVFTVLFSYLLKPIGVFAFCLQSLTATFYSLLLFYGNFNKVILSLSFVYTTIAYFFYLLIRVEFKEPFYQAARSGNVLSSYDKDELKVTIEKGNGSYDYFLTNWGKTGFYCRGDDKGLSGRVKVSILVNGVHFSAIGLVVSRGAGGIGVKVMPGKTKGLCWEHFYDIINELGLKPLVT